MAINDSDRIARYGNLVIYENSGVLVAECTDAEKRKWEADHPQPEPEPKAEQ